MVRKVDLKSEDSDQAATTQINISHRSVHMRYKSAPVSKTRKFANKPSRTAHTITTTQAQRWTTSPRCTPTQAVKHRMKISSTLTSFKTFHLAKCNHTHCQPTLSTTPSALLLHQRTLSHSTASHSMISSIQSGPSSSC